MTGSGNVWIVTEQALLAPNVPSGTLGLELVAAANEEGHIGKVRRVPHGALWAHVCTVRAGGSS